MIAYLSSLLQKKPLSNFFALSVFIFFISCSSDPMEFGSNIIPANDKLELKKFDTTITNVKTIQGNPLVANNKRWVFLGFNKDEYCTIKADFCAKFSLTYLTSKYQNIPDEMKNLLESSAKINEIYLQLYCLGSSDYSDWIRINVYKIKNDLPNDSVVLKSNFKIDDYKGELYASEIVYPADTLVKINLPLSFADLLKNADTSALKNPDTLTARIFKGFYITIDTNSYSKLLLSIPIYNGNNGIFINYTYNDVDTNVHLIFKYDLSKAVSLRDYNYAFNHIEYYGTDKINNDKQIYIQTFGTYYGYVDLKSIIEPMRNELPLSINNASISLFLDTNIISKDNPLLLSKLTVKYINSSGEYETIEDAKISSVGYFNETVNSSNWFNLNISKFVRSCLNENIKPELYITPADTSNMYMFKKLILKNDRTTPVKFSVTFHKL